MRRKISVGSRQRSGDMNPTVIKIKAGFVVDKVALGQVFSDYFGFPCQFLFHQFLHNRHHLSSGADTIGQ
jgi:hypothetical protein